VQGELDDVREARVETHVEDWRDEIVYQLFVDRFENGDPSNDWRVDPSGTHLARYQGGDWQGVIDRMDYLVELGITAIWISPIVLNVDTDAGVDGYHGYWQVDLTRLNPHFGDLATLRRLVNACHARGIKVILDIVTNHMGQVFYYDINMNGRPDENIAGGLPLEPGNPSSGAVRTPVTHTTEYDPDYDPRGIQSFTSLGESGPAPIRFFDMPEIFRVPPEPAVFRRHDAYNRRGRVIRWDDLDQVVYGDFPGGLKDLATENPLVRDALVEVFVDWVLSLDLDGFRIDTLKHVEYAFWEHFAPEVRRRLAERGKRNFLMFGEAFDGDDALVGSFTMPGRIDSVFYFPHKFQVINDVFMNEGPTSNVERLFLQRATNYGTVPQEAGVGAPPTQVLVSFMDNHDVPRFLFQKPSIDALHAALAYLLTMDGIPCIYYGTEQQFDGGNDPANREPMWTSAHGAFDTDNETFRWIAELTRIRRQYVALRRGDFVLRWTTDRVGDEEDAGILAYERTTTEGDYALVVVNTQSRHPSTTAFGPDAMEVGAAPGSVLVDALTGERVTVDGAGTLTVTVAQHGAMILVPEADFSE
jgi:glycosidase